MYRQGDVMIVPCAVVPKGAKAVEREGGRLVLAHGEVTGHAHAVAEMDAEMFSERDGVLYLRCPSGAAVKHEEHSAVTLAPGTYKVTRQRQYSAGMVQKVPD